MRLQVAEQNFSQKQAEREQHLRLAEECQTEMTKLQGEYRVLQELLEPDEPLAEANVIEVIPEDKPKKKGKDA